MRLSFAVLIIGLLACSTAVSAMDTAERQAARSELESLAANNALSRSFNLIHQLVGPSVVSIHINQQLLGLDRRTGGVVRQEVEVGEGSGFVVRSDETGAWILTNAHVVLQTNRSQGFIQDEAGAPVWYTSIRVATTDQRVFDAKPIGADPQSDLAMIFIEAPDLPAVTWGDSDAAGVGDWVVALGFPLGVGYSASAGIISAKERSTGIYQAERGFESFLQTDAAINPGNSGGPMVDLRGQVIGVNANIISKTGSSIGLGFAIPAKLARRVAEDLIDDGRIDRPMIGIQMAPIEAEEADRLQVPNRRAVTVERVMPGSAAERGGLQAGDAITGVGGRDIAGIEQLRLAIAAARIGQDLAFTVWREGQSVDLTIVPESWQVYTDRAREMAEALQEETIEWPRFGLRIGDDGMRGLVVQAVARGSAADRAGLRRGNRILRIGSLGPVDRIDAALEELDARTELVLEVYKDRRIILMRLRAP